MPALDTKHPAEPDHVRGVDDVFPDRYGQLNTVTGDGTWGQINERAVESQFWHLVMGDPNQEQTEDGQPSYEPLQADLLNLPKKDDVVLGPAAACAAKCKEEAKLRETECDKLRARVVQALKEGHCPSRITGIRKMPCGTKKKAPKKKSTKSKK